MATKIEKQTAKLMKAKLERKLQTLFAEQEAMKRSSGNSTFANGGVAGGLKNKIRGKKRTALLNKIANTDKSATKYSNAFIKSLGYDVKKFNDPKYASYRKDILNKPYGKNKYSTFLDPSHTVGDMYNSVGSFIMDNADNLDLNNLNINDIVNYVNNTPTLGFKDQLLQKRKYDINRTGNPQQNFNDGGIIKAGGGLRVPPINTLTNLSNFYSGPDSTTLGGYGTGSPGYSVTPPDQPLFNGWENFMGGVTQGVDWLKDNKNTFGQLAPVGYNILRGLQKPQYLNAPDYYNPEYNATKTLLQSTKNEVNSLMGNRRFDINPVIQSNVAANNATVRNLSNISSSAGGFQSNQLAANAALNRANANAYATANNANNQYIGQQAQMLGQLGMNQAGLLSNLGGQQANTNLQVRDINDRNLAARNQYLGTGLSNLSGYSQMQQLMGNQKEADAIRAGLLPDMFSNVYQFMNLSGLDKLFNNNN